MNVSTPIGREVPSLTRRAQLCYVDVASLWVTHEETHVPDNPDFRTQFLPLTCTWLHHVVWGSPCSQGVVKFIAGVVVAIQVTVLGSRVTGQMLSIRYEQTKHLPVGKENRLRMAGISERGESSFHAVLVRLSRGSTLYHFRARD